MKRKERKWILWCNNWDNYS